MKLTIKILTQLFAVTLLFTAMSCAKLDVVATDSSRAFDELLKAMESKSLLYDNGDDWQLMSPAGDARFIFSKNKATVTDQYTLMEVNLAPFIAAGLDPALLPTDIFRIEDDLMVLGFATKITKATNKEDTNPLDSYNHILTLNRSRIGYHKQLDHYGIDLGNGNLFEWAKDMGANDKDLVFVLDPQPFIAAGADVYLIEGWTFGKVTVDDENLQPVEKDKLLKPSELL